MKYSFITQYKKTWSISLMCQVLGVCRNAYYSFVKREAIKPVDPDWDYKIELVKEIAKASKYSYFNGVR